MKDEPNPVSAEDDPELLSIAKALSDGHPVDWSVGGEEEEEKRRLLQHLRFLQSVAEAHRRVLATSPGDSLE